MIDGVVVVAIILGMSALVGFIGWLVGYGMGVRDYRKNRDFIENG